MARRVLSAAAIVAVLVAVMVLLATSLGVD